jgi:hypothetical protein
MLLTPYKYNIGLVFAPFHALQTLTLRMLWLASTGNAPQKPLAMPLVTTRTTMTLRMKIILT